MGNGLARLIARLLQKGWTNEQLAGLLRLVPEDAVVEACEKIIEKKLGYHIRITDLRHP